MKLTKAESKLHLQALELVAASDGRKLTFEEREFILSNFHPAASNNVTTDGAFFTPIEIAEAFTLEVSSSTLKMKVIDLCAGIGMLAYHVWMAHRWKGTIEIVCVEKNPEYVRVGKAVLPEAIWVEADVFDMSAYRHLGPFTFCVSNPPFGNVKVPARVGAEAGYFDGKYKGNKFEYKVMELAREVAMYGVFIVPQTSSPYFYSGSGHTKTNTSRDLKQFSAETGIVLEASCIDTEACEAKWRGVKVQTEVVVADLSLGFEDAIQVETSPDDSSVPAVADVIRVDMPPLAKPAKGIPVQAALF